MSATNRKNQRPLLPAIVFGVICIALGAMILNRPGAKIETRSVPQTDSTASRAATNSTPTDPLPTPDKEDHVAALTADGNTFLANKNFPGAEQKFGEAIALSPDQEDLHYNLAIALAKQGKIAEAKKEYEEALRIYPEYAEALNNLGNLLMSENKLDEAIARFQEAIKGSPENSSYHNNLGTALARQKRVTEAMAEFDQAVKLAPAYVEARVNLANTFLATSRTEEAIGQLSEALRLKPDFGPAIQTMQRARALLRK